MNLKNFIGYSEQQAINEALRGEEKDFFTTKILEIINIIETMPKTYETDGQGKNAKAVLHYFNGNSDWYITEKDMEEEQIQAFGFACINGNGQGAESGYINIAELIKHGVELDLYYTPERLGDIIARHKGA